MSEKLKGCPFCGGAPTGIAVSREFAPVCDVICGCGGSMNSCNDEADAIEAWNTRTPTNESPAPQATKKTYIKPLRTIVEIDARYADQIRDLLNNSAPQPPVEGLREAANHLLQTLNSLSLGLLSPDQNETSSEMASMASSAIPDATMLVEAVAALASPSLTAGDVNTSSYLSLADLIERKRKDVLDQYGLEGFDKARRDLLEVLWNDKGTFAPALRLAARLAALSEN